MLSYPSWWGMFVYREDTSIDASIHSFGNLVFSMSFINSLESCMYEGSCLTYGWSQWSTNADMFSVMLSQLDTIGLIP